jgi:hypothetical protein
MVPITKVFKNLGKPSFNDDFDKYCRIPYAERTETWPQ